MFELVIRERMLSKLQSSKSCDLYEIQHLFRCRYLIESWHAADFHESFVFFGTRRKTSSLLWSEGSQSDTTKPAR